MRAWISCLFILLVSAFWFASPALAATAQTVHFAKATVVEARIAGQHEQSQRCNRLEDKAVITAANNQYETCCPTDPAIIHKSGAFIDSTVNAYSPVVRGNARIQPFYRLILFPFHVFW